MEPENRLRLALDRAFADVRAAAEAEVVEVRQSAELTTAQLRASSARLADCVHAIDEAPSLGSVLTVVAGCARLEAGRASIILVTNGTLTSYPSRAEVPADQARLATSAVEKGVAVVEAAAGAAAFPIAVGGQVVAVVSTSAPSTPEAHAALDVLTRHAGRVLEAMTMCQITGVSPVAAPVPDIAGGSA